MAVDPRSYSQFYCPKNLQQTISNQSTQRNFFGALGKIGDLQVLNDIKGLDKVGRGLRVLNSISNSVRTGANGALPTGIGQSIETGANWVLNTMGIDPNTLASLQALNPGIANQAYGQARQIYSKIKQGQFNFAELPSYLQDFQNLERLIRGIYTPTPNEFQGRPLICDNSPYAMDLIGLKGPKFKFLFVVEFLFNDQYSPALKNINNTFAFTVQTTTRPVPQYQMEDINMYNFRTKIITKTTFDEMRMRFYDDQGNHATDFFKAFVQSTIPITNTSTSAQAQAMFDNGGMLYKTKTAMGLGQQGTQGNASSIAADSIMYPFSAASYSPPVMGNGTINNVIREIRLYHVYSWGRFFNLYKFFNPRLMSLRMDDLDMSQSGPCMFEITFNYDAFSTFVNQDMKSQLSGTTGEDVGDPKGLTQYGAYPLRYVGDQTAGSPITNAPPGQDPQNKGLSYRTANATVPQSPQRPIPSTGGASNSPPPVNINVADFDNRADPMEAFIGDDQSLPPI